MADWCARDVYCLLGLPIDAVDLAGAVRHVQEAAASRERCFLSTPNLNFLVACLHDPAFRQSVLASDLNTADGMPLVWIARLLGIPLPERVAGSELFERLRKGGSGTVSVYFFGGPPGAAAMAAQRINAGSAGMTCVGFESPGYGSVEDMSSADTIDRINASGADFLVVALGARKGQAWIVRNRPRISVPVISHLGAVVNFAAGTVTPAPQWIRRVGLEWCWRIKEERNLWRRYAGDGAALLRLLVSRVLPYWLY